MADQFTTVTRTSFLGNLMNSLIGAVIGVLLFFGAFVVLWINEGRIDLSTVARKSVAISAASVAPANEGKLVAASGNLRSGEQLGDPGFIAPGNYLQLERAVEMYAWHEQKETTTHKNLGGSSVTETRYTYTKEWTRDPASSSDFGQPQGHENPPLALQGVTEHVRTAKLDAYTVDPATLTFPDGTPLALTPQTIRPQGSWQQSGSYLINHPSAASDQPQIGDLRVSYKAVTNDLPVTLFGKVNGDRIGAYIAPKVTLYRAFTGNRDSAIATLHSEYTLLLWILRLVGFLMMWFGLMLAFQPVNTFLDIIPAVGSVTGCLTSMIMLGLAAVLSGVTIVIGIIAHNVILLALTVVVIGGAAVLVLRRRGQRRVGMPPAAA